MPNQKTSIRAMMMGAMLACTPFLAQAATITTPFSFDWNGLPLGKATLNFETTDATYQSSLDGMAYGLPKLFVQMNTQTSSSGSFSGNDLLPSSYDSAYQMKNKNKEIHLRWNGKGVLTKETLVPATDKEKRPEVPAAQKKGAMDPLSAFWQLHRWLQDGGKLTTPGSTADIKMWDGKRLFDLQVSTMRDVVWHEGKKAMNATKLRLRRVAIRGFTPDEQTSLDASQSKEFYLYFCAEDTLNCKDREPLGMEMPVLLGMLRASKASPTAAPVAPVQGNVLSLPGMPQ